MEAIFAAGGGMILGSVIAICVFLLAILWIVLPFAVFGIKKRLDRVLAEAQTMNQHLREIRSEIGKQQGGVLPIRAER